MFDEYVFQSGNDLFIIKDFSVYNAEIKIETDSDEVHKLLMSKASFRLGCPSKNAYYYLIDGKIVKVVKK